MAEYYTIIKQSIKSGIKWMFTGIGMIVSIYGYNYWNTSRTIETFLSKFISPNLIPFNSSNKIISVGSHCCFGLVGGYCFGRGFVEHATITTLISFGLYYMLPKLNLS